MRRTLWLTVIANCVLAFLVRFPSPVTAGRDGEPLLKGPPSKPGAKPLLYKQEVEGYGEEADDARARVLENACDSLANYLAETHHETNYKPTKEFLQELKVIPFTSDIEVTKSPLPNLPNMKKATVQIEVSQDSLKKMREQARQQRVTQRQHWMGLGLAGFLAFLLVAVGYLRLEEATKGYYTGLLRASALGVLVMAGVFIVYLI